MRYSAFFTLLLSAICTVVADRNLNHISPVDSVVYIGPRGSDTAAHKTSSTSSGAVTPTSAPYWLEQVKHQGIAAFNPSPSTYQVFRNVKDFGAKGKSTEELPGGRSLTRLGDGVTDDTAAINSATSSGGRCAPGSCNSTTTTPAIVYFPAGTYLLSSSIIDYYFTQYIGNPNSLPILKATPNFSGFGLIDGDRYGANGLQFGATNVFYRQVRNLIFDVTAVPSSSAAYGIHWPTAQATSLQNCVFKMSDAPGTQHEGIFIEGGKAIREIGFPHLED